MISPPNPRVRSQQENLSTPRSPMVGGGKYEACSDVHDGSFYRFWRRTCRDMATRNRNCP